MIYRLEETKGMTKAIGNWVVKRKGKAIQYFMDKAEAEHFVQSCVEMERAQ